MHFATFHLSHCPARLPKPLHCTFTQATARLLKPLHDYSSHALVLLQGRLNEVQHPRPLAVHNRLLHARRLGRRAPSPAALPGAAAVARPAAGGASRVGWAPTCGTHTREWHGKERERGKESEEC